MHICIKSARTHTHTLAHIKSISFCSPIILIKCEGRRITAIESAPKNLPPLPLVRLEMRASKCKCLCEYVQETEIEKGIKTSPNIQTNINKRLKCVLCIENGLCVCVCVHLNGGDSGVSNDFFGCNCSVGWLVCNRSQQIWCPGIDVHLIDLNHKI